MLRPWHIAVLEVKRFVVDPGRLAFSLALPIVLFALMYGAFSEAGQFNGTAHLVDLDEGPMARELIARLERVDGLQVKLHTSADADRALDRANILSRCGHPGWILRGPHGRQSRIDHLQAARLRRSSRADSRHHHPKRGPRVGRRGPGPCPGSRRAQGILRQTTPRSTKPSRSLLDQARENPPVTVKSRTIGGQSDPLSRLLPGIMTMFLLFSVTLGATTLVEERRIGTLERLMTTRLSIDQLFLGKFLAGASIAALQALILLALAFLVLQVAGVTVFVEAMVFALLIAAAVSAAGLVIGSLARTPDQASWIAVFFTMAMTVFAGTFFDVGDSGPLAVISRFTINKYSIDGLADIVAGGGLGQQGFEAAVLIGVTIVGLVVARFAFRATQAG